MSIRLVSFTIAAATLATAHAAPPVSVADLYTAPSPRSSNLGRVGWIAGSAVPPGLALLRTNINTSVLQVWLTDGTADGTRIVSGLPPSLLPPQITPISAARNAAGAIILTLSRPEIGTSYYAIDPATAQATLLLEGAGLSGLAPVGNRFVFAFDDGIHGRELWSTDGTPGGTAMLADLSPGAASSSLSVLSGNGTAAWFAALPSGETVRRLFITDGTALGTFPLGPVSPTSGDASTSVSAAISGGIIYAARDTSSSPLRLYFATQSSAPAAALSAAAGTITPGTGPILSTGTHALLVGTDSGSTQHLYITDGAQSTSISESALAFTNDLAVVPEPGAPFGWTAYYGGGATASTTEPCRTDGTRDGTSVVADLNPGSDPSSPGNFIAFGSAAYFRTSSYSSSGGTYNATFLSVTGQPAAITDLGSAMGAPTSISPLSVVGGQLLCAGSDSRGSELWSFDPALAQFTFVADLSPGEAGHSSPFLVATTPQAALLAARTDQWPYQFVVTGGTAATTIPARTGGQPLSYSFFGCTQPLGVLNDQFIAFANSGPSGEEPWSINPTTGGGTLLRDIRIGGAGSQPGSSFFTSAASFACQGSFTSAVVGAPPVTPRSVFAASPSSPSGGATYGVWSTDGTPAGTTELTRHRTETGLTTLLFNFTPLGSRAFFLAPPLMNEFSQFDTDLWVTDGTIAGTQRAVPLRPLGIISTTPNQLVAWNGRLYFTATTSGTLRLFTSDGTPAGTALADIGPEASALRLGLIYPTSLGLVFSTTSVFGGPPTLWITNGTPSGTRRILPESSDTQYSTFNAITDAGSHFFFATWTRSAGREVWVSDGTPEGTRLVADLNPGPGSSDPSFLRILPDGRLIFSAFTPSRGIELWQTDGSASGTRLITDLVPGPGSSAPTNAALIGNNLVFTADDGSPIGRELWSIELTPPCRCDTDNSGAATLQDLFDFLNLWFVSDPRADISNDSLVTIQDIFDFLTCWFTGCE